MVLRMIDTNTLVTDLGAHQHALEEELAQTASERDTQRAVVEQKAKEAEAQTAELRRARTALEQKEVELQRKEAELQGKEAELQREKATVATLTGTLEEKGKALEEKGRGLPECGGRPQGEGELLVFPRGGRPSLAGRGAEEHRW